MWAVVAASELKAMEETRQPAIRNTIPVSSITTFIQHLSLIFLEQKRLLQLFDHILRNFLKQKCPYAVLIEILWLIRLLAQRFRVRFRHLPLWSWSAAGSLCNTAENLRVERETYTPEAKKILKTSAKSGAKKTGLSWQKDEPDSWSGWGWWSWCSPPSPCPTRPPPSHPYQQPMSFSSPTTRSLKEEYQ